jgi:L-ascorbate metabolism protein UlaG (beta-lactamase superfamily)
MLAACGGSRPPAPAPAAAAPLALTYLGVAGWRLDGGPTTILVDPYLSRPADLEGPLVSDPAAIARAPARAAAILVGHSHVDHVLDVPAIARRTGAEVIGTISTTRYARAAGVPSDQVITVGGGEDLAFAGWSLRVLPSLHSALSHKHASGRWTELAEGQLPSRFDEFVEGGTLAYLVRLGGHQVLVLSTANFIERELDGLRPDVAIVATGLREEVHDYACRLMRALGRPPLVIANHFDDWHRPPQPRAALDGDARADLVAFAAEIHACAPATRVVVPDPGVAIEVP